MDIRADNGIADRSTYSLTPRFNLGNKYGYLNLQVKSFFFPFTGIVPMTKIFCKKMSEVVRYFGWKTPSVESSNLSLKQFLYFS